MSPRMRALRAAASRDANVLLLVCSWRPVRARAGSCFFLSLSTELPSGASALRGNPRAGAQ